MYRVRLKSKSCECGHENYVHLGSAHNCTACGCTKFRTASKYKAKREEVNGEHYDSKREAREGAELGYQLRAGAIKYFKRQVRIPLVVNEHRICEYVVDFEIGHLDGTTEYREVKGFVTRDWLLKWKLFEALYGGKPGVRLVVAR